MSKTGYYKIYATNDEELKKQLLGLHVTKIVLSGSSFTPSGFRDAETQYLKSIKCVGRVVDRAILKAFSEPKGLESPEIGGMGDKFNSNNLAELRGCKCLCLLTVKAFRRYNKNVHPDRSRREQRTVTDFITPFSSDTKI